MTKTLLALLLVLALAAPCLAQGDREPRGGEGWGDGDDHRRPGSDDMGDRPGGPDGMGGPRGPGDDRERDGRMGPRPPHPPEPPRRLSDDEIEETLKFLRDWDPYRVRRIEEMRERNPDQYMQALTQSYFEMKRVQEMKESNPEAFAEMQKERDLEKHCFELAEQVRKTDDAAEKEKLKGELRPVLEQLFDVREKHKDDEIKRLEEELKRLRDQVDKRRKNKAAIVDKRVQELSGETEEDKW